MGYPVFYSDKEAKNCMDSDEVVHRGLIDLFGDEAFIDNHLNKPFLAKKIFSDQSLIKKVNELVHPRVRARFEEWANEQSSSIIFNEAAILFETGAYKTFDAIILVTAPESLRIERVAHRDSISEVEVISRIKNQWSDEQKIPLANFIIDNDEKKGLLTQVEKIIEDLNVEISK